MYSDGRGVPRDDAKAIEWFLKAANQGFAPAQINLGVLYERGQGVPKDFVQGYKWLSLSTSRFHESDREYRDKALAMREALAKLMTPAEIAEAERLRAGLESQMKAGSGGLQAHVNGRETLCGAHDPLRPSAPVRGTARAGAIA